MTDAADFVRTMERRTGLKVGAPEDAVWRQGFLARDELRVRAEKLVKSGYGNYLLAPDFTTCLPTRYTAISPSRSKQIHRNHPLQSVLALLLDECATRHTDATPPPQPTHGLTMFTQWEHRRIAGLPDW